VLLEKSRTGTLKAGTSGDDIKHIHEHLRRFNFDLELCNSTHIPATDSDDVKHDHWGAFTTRALRMFAAHPQVNQEAPAIVVADGSALTEAIARKMQQWCSQGITSPKNYWEFEQLQVSNGIAQKIDAHG